MSYNAAPIEPSKRPASKRPASIPPVSATDAGRNLPQLLTLSAPDAPALSELIRQTARRLRGSALSQETFCRTANGVRAALPARFAAVAAPGESLPDKLTAAEGTPAPRNTWRGTAAPVKTAFIFTGQGAQYPGMGKKLYETQGTFRTMMDRADEILSPLLGRPLLPLLFEPANAGLLNETAYAQPALFAIEYALATLWRSWGIEPDVVMGHSVGEYVAAALAGVFSLEDGLKLMAARGRLMQAAPGDGTMSAVMADERTVREAMAQSLGGISVAAVNGPKNTVISGERSRVAALTAQLEARDIACLSLKVSHAFHSPLMEAMLPEFRMVLQGIRFGAPEIPLISNVTGTPAAGDQIACPDYWCGHILAPVRFSDSLTTLRRAGTEVFVEVGPAPVLTGMARRIPEMKGAHLLQTLRRGANDLQSALETLGQLFVRGLAVDWEGFNGQRAPIV